MSEQFLVDFGRDEKRFVIKELLYEGRSYQIALAEDRLMDDKLVCAKTIAYDAARMDDKRYVAQRRKALHNELKILSLPTHLLPEPLDWIQQETSETVMGREPVLVYEYAHGQNLYDYITQNFPEGINPIRALRIFKELVAFLGSLHGHGYVFRDLDPRHFIISVDDIIHVVGCGNITAIGEAPNATKMDLNPSYSAPEIRSETSGQFLRPAADFYGVGALLSFLLSGEEPRESVENPLTKTAFDRLSAVDPAGVTLLMSKCMQPLAKNRFGRAERLLPMCDPETLPTSTTKGFGLLQLPAPWSGAERPDNRAANSSISSGPLISVQQQPEATNPQGQKALQKKEPKGCRRILAPFGLIVVLVVLALVFAV